MRQPKPFLNHLKTRHKAFGTERRLNMTKMVLEDAVAFPKGVEVKDIDAELENWVKEKLDLSYDGKRLPTFQLFSNQRINEYAQTWNHLDENGNVLMNFKTITRENNPKHGENQGNSYNIPGERTYPMFQVPVLQENGLVAYDIYSMKQPYAINLEYTVCIITNRYELINEMNQKVNYLFKALNCYISPNNHFMPMELEDISDESEYSIDDRKYYSQNYKIKVMAYIIHEEDFKVTHMPSRLKINWNITDPKRKRTKANNNNSVVITEQQIPLECIPFDEDYVEWEEQEKEVVNDSCPTPLEKYLEGQKKQLYKNKEIVVTMTFDLCDETLDFIIDTDFVVESIELDNIHDFKLFVNGEEETFERSLTKLYKNDEIHVEVLHDKIDKDMVMTMRGYDPNTLVEIEPTNESSLDDQDEVDEIEIK